MTEWKTYTLKELSKGRGEYGIGAPAVPFDKEKYTYLRITDINDDGTLNTSGMMSVDADDAEEYILEKNDIVFARTGNSTGRSYFYDGRDGELVYAGFLIRFRLDETKVNPKILKYYTHSKPYYNWVKSFDTGGTRGNINAKTYGDMPIYLPPRHIQDRIAGILGAIDDKIENNRRINDNLEQQAQALFDNLILDTNLKYSPISEVEHIIETGRRPKGGVANITAGVPSIGAENIKGLGKYDYSKTKYITSEFAESLKKGVIKGYELLIYKDGGKPGYFIPNFSIFGEGYPYEDMTLNEHVFLLDFGNKGYNFFAYFFMQTEEVMKYLNAQGSKAAIPGINRNDVESIFIPTIDNKEVKEFCDIVEPIITAVLVNSKESSRLASLRDTLLPKLMNGEIKI